LDVIHSLNENEKVGGTGFLQNMPNGTNISHRELIRYMIVDSDNTATNIMIDALGGFNPINEEILRLGCNETHLNRKMLDTQALANGIDNYISVNDAGNILKKLYTHTLISELDDAEMLRILSENNNHNKLPALLPSDVTVYNKTGEYNDYGVQNDIAIIENGKGAFVVTVLSQNGIEREQVAMMNQLGQQLYMELLG
ncbi:MAG: class A beta-lactamase-related serine hydrolase, partial [Clostridiales Family XIII bacterium]|nr:class A beta-lactamase-related serine hydrolase [Clostridiales Family XIII bacterium]